MISRRVVVTGMGMVTALGASVEQTWAGILAGKSGIRAIEHFDTSAFSTQFAGMVTDFVVEDYLPAKEARRVDAFIQYGLAAGQQALVDSGLQVTDANADRVGVAVGSGIGGLTTIEDGHRNLLEGGPRKISPFFVPGSIINMAAGMLSIRHGLKGPNF